ncbi:MAG: ATP-binding protein [Deinococcota bacterium]
MSMKINLEGRVSKLPLAQAKGLLPMFEAVVNSIHAIQDTDREDGKITVTLLRDKTQVVLVDGDEGNQILPLQAFHITDNGIGFTEDNFDSFLTSDSRYKVDRGGRGVGRLLWLKAFEHVDISSIYVEDDKKYRREFRFSLTDDPEKISKITSINQEAELETTVKLYGFIEKYALATVRKIDVVAKRLVEHCLPFFILDEMPRLDVFDSMTGTHISANSLYKEYRKHTKKEDLLVGEENFNLTHVMFQASSGMDHKINYCADYRVVHDRLIKPTDVNGISNRLKTPEEEEESGSVYIACLSGKYLDNHVNDDRTSFHFPKEDELSLGISSDAIESSVLERSRQFLEPYTTPALEKNRDRIVEFIQKRRPKYRALAKHHSEMFDTIPSSLNDDKLDTELYKLDREVGLQLQKQADELLMGKKIAQTEDYRKFLEQLDDYAKSQLSDYIAHRHWFLRLLETSLALDENDKYAPEKAIHNIIFPMGVTSDDIGPEDHNLWIIDEKLAYHLYLTSDQQIRTLGLVDSEARGEPDLVIFNFPIAIVNEKDPPYQSIVIIEFKRPMRDDYRDGTPEDYKGNPIDQINRYVMDIQAGTRDHKGRPLEVDPQTPFYCYIIADLSDSLKTSLKSHSFQKTPDGLGFYHYNSQLHSYTEVISYTKLIKDAKNRNRVFFDKLNLPFI